MPPRRRAIAATMPFSQFRHRATMRKLPVLLEQNLDSQTCHAQSHQDHCQQKHCPPHTKSIFNKPKSNSRNSFHRTPAKKPGMRSGRAGLGLLRFRCRGNRPRLTLFILVPEHFPNLGFQLLAQFRIILQQLLDRIPALTELGIVIAEPGTTLLEHAQIHAQIDDFADFGNPLAVKQVEFGLTERRRNLVLDHLDLDSP